MSNGEFCCAIGLCCPPASASRRTALINELAIGMPVPKALDQAHAETAGAVLEHVADWLIAHVDMVPKGTIDLEKVRDAWQQAHHDHQ